MRRSERTYDLDAQTRVSESVQRRVPPAMTDMEKQYEVRLNENGDAYRRLNRSVEQGMR